MNEINYNGTTIYASEEALANLDHIELKYYTCGAGGNNQDASLIRSAFQNGTMPTDCIYALGNSCADQRSFYNAIDYVVSRGGHIDSYVPVGFSAGGGTVIQTLPDLFKIYPGLKDVTTPILIDPYSNKTITDFSVFKGMDIKIIGPNNYTRQMKELGPDVRTFATNMGKDGANINALFYDNAGDSNFHATCNRMGLNYLFLSDDPQVDKFITEHYDSKTQALIKGYKEEINKRSYGSEFKVILDSNDLETLKTNGLNIKKPFDLFGNSAPSAETILSNVAITLNSVNSISSAMNNNNGLFDTRHTNLENSTANVVNGVLSGQNAFLSISNDLHHRVRDELNMITKIAQNYYDMDGDLSEMASKLEDGNSVRIGARTYNYTALGDIVNYTADSNITFFKNFQIPFSTSVEKIGSVSISDIDNILDPNGAFMSNMNAEKETAQKTKIEITNLKNEIGTSLKGKVWNSVKENLSMIEALEQTKIESCDKLTSACKKALQKMKDYIAPDAFLDTTQIPVLEEEVQNLTKSITEYNTMINAGHYEERTTSSTDSKGKTISSTYSVWVWDYSPEDRYTMQQQVIAWRERISEAKKEIAKLNGFEAIVKQATEIINEALQEIYGSYGSQVSDYVSGRSGSYVPSYETKTASFNYLDMNNDGLIDEYAVPNKYGIPYINQNDLPQSNPLNGAGCGWASMAMIMSGATGQVVDMNELYLRQRGYLAKGYTTKDGKFYDANGNEVPFPSFAYNPAQRDDLGTYGASEEQLAYYTNNGVTPTYLGRVGAKEIGAALEAGEAVIVCTSSHYSVLAPTSDGKIAYLSSRMPKQNGTYTDINSVMGNVYSTGEINYVASYKIDGSGIGNNGAIVSPKDYSPTIKNPGQIVTPSTPSYSSPATSVPVNSALSAPVNPASSALVNPEPITPVNPESITPVNPAPITPVNPEPTTPVEENPIDVKPIEDKPIEDKPIINKPIEDKPSIPEPSKPSKPSIPGQSKPSKPSIPNAYKPPVDKPVVEDPIIENPIIEPPHEEVPIIEIPDDIPVIEDPVIDLPKPEYKPSSNSQDVAKTIGVLTGVGAAVGAAAYGAYKYTKSKEEPENKTYDEEEDY